MRFPRVISYFFFLAISLPALTTWAQNEEGVGILMEYKGKVWSKLDSSSCPANRRAKKPTIVFVHGQDVRDDLHRGSGQESLERMSAMATQASKTKYYAHILGFAYNYATPIEKSGARLAELLRPWVKKHRLYLVGMSQGSLVVRWAVEQEELGVEKSLLVVPPLKGLPKEMKNIISPLSMVGSLAVGLGRTITGLIRTPMLGNILPKFDPSETVVESELKETGKYLKSLEQLLSGSEVLQTLNSHDMSIEEKQRSKIKYEIIQAYLPKASSNYLPSRVLIPLVYKKQKSDGLIPTLSNAEIIDVLPTIPKKFVEYKNMNHAEFLNRAFALEEFPSFLKTLH